MGHLGRDKLVDTLREWYWWPGMVADVADVIRKCESCAKDRRGGEPVIRPSVIYKGEQPF